MSKRTEMGTGTREEKPVAAFVLSLIAGILILAGSAMITTFYFGVRYFGGMMGGYYGMMNGYKGMVNMLGFGGGWSYVPMAIGVISGIIILVGAIMIYNQPSKTLTWGVLIVVFSVVSFFGMGGFFLGAILGVVGGILALTEKPGNRLKASI